MAKSPGMSTPRVMVGDGFYNEHAAAQAGMARYGLEPLRRAAAEVPLTAPVRVADYGSSQGKNSLLPLRLALDVLHSRGAREIEVTHVDQPGNDFNSLFRVLHGPGTYLQADVFASARGGSFYERLFPAGQLTLGWTAVAVHWLSRVPGALRDHLWLPLAEPEARALWADAARQDWTAFTAARAQEFLPGGQLVVVGAAADASGRAGGEGLFQLAWETFQELGARPGCLPCYPRQPHEFLEPLDPRWEVLESEHAASPDPLRAPEDVVAWFRAAFHTSLEPPDAFYPALLERVRAHPEQARSDWWVFAFRLRRRG